MESPITRECQALREEIALLSQQNAALLNRLMLARRAIEAIGMAGEAMADELVMLMDHHPGIREDARQLVDRWGDASVIASTIF